MWKGKSSLITLLKSALKKNGFKLNDAVSGYMFLSPVLLWIAVFMAYPLYYIVYLSFFEWNLIDTEKTFIGFNNFVRMFQDDEFIASLVQTLHFTIGKVILSMVCALLIAILLNQKIRGIVAIRGFF